MSHHEWFRSPEYDDVAMVEFERRLARARAYNRPQFLRIKALHLRKAGGDERLRLASLLLQRIVDEYPEAWIEVASAHEVLGDAHVAARDLEAAAREYAASIEVSPTGSGTSGMCGIKLAEVKFSLGALAEAQSTIDLADERTAEHASLRMFPIEYFRYCVFQARLAERTGKKTLSAEWAGRALRCALQRKGPLVAEPRALIVPLDDSRLKEMQRLASPGKRRLRVIPLLTLLVLLSWGLSGCGDPVTSEPSPEAIETAESIARDVRIDASYSTTPTADDADQDPIVLDGRVFGDGDVGVILTHMRPSDQSSWFPFATKLAQSGDFTVLTFDFRGYGESTGEKQFDRIDTDLEAAYEYARDTLGLDEIFLVGASMGGTAALVTGARVDATGIISISSLGQLPEIDAELTVGDITEPKLFIVSEDDVPQFRSQERFWELARAPKDQHIYPGDSHGTDIFATEHGADLEQRIIDFIELNSDMLSAR